MTATAPPVAQDPTAATAPAPPATPAAPPAAAAAPPADASLLGAPAADPLPSPATPTSPGEPTGQEPGAAPWTPTLPDGFELDTALLDQFRPLADGLQLDGSGRQQLVDLYVAAQQQWQTAALAALDAQTEQWRAATLADPETGGADWQQKILIAREAIGLLMPSRAEADALRAALVALRIDNHPLLVKLLYRAGTRMRSDTIAGSTAPPPVRPASLTEKLERDIYTAAPK